MEADIDLAAGAQRNQGYRSLPPTVRLEDTIGSVDAAPRQDPDAVRNLDQHRALRND